MLLGYARVSTIEQDTKLQTDALKRAGCSRIFSEKASGAKVDRPELMRILDIARDGDIIVVWKLDRLARSTKQLIDTIEKLRERKIGFKCLTMDIDTTTSSGRLIYSIFAGLAEFERDLIRERTMAGLAAARAEGRVGGRPRKLSDDDLETARDFLKSGEDMREVATRLGVSRATLYANGVRRYPVIKKVVHATPLPKKRVRVNQKKKHARKAKRRV